MKRKNNIKEVKGKQDVSPFSISEVMYSNRFNENTPDLNGEEMIIVSEILNKLSSQRISNALQILETSKHLILECTLAHEEYIL